ncbi:MAG: hypothetical protein ABIK28_14215, partial [Planctomycetota bacterium]
MSTFSQTPESQKAFRVLLIIHGMDLNGFCKVMGESILKSHRAYRKARLLFYPIIFKYLMEYGDMKKHSGFTQLIAMFLLPALLFLIQGTAIASGSTGEVSATFSAGSYEIHTTAEGHEIIMEGFGRIPVFGKPFLPSKVFS